MTINSEIRRAGPFTGNGVTNRFPFDFKVFRAEDLYVVVAPAEGDGELPLHLGTDYTVELNPDQNANPGGTIVLPSALPTGELLTATSSLEYLQPIDLTNQGGFYPRVINDGLDRLTIFVQQLFEGLGRSLKIPLSDGPINTVLPGRNRRKGTVLAFHEDTGAPIVGPSIATVNTVADAIGKVNTVADNIGGVNTVADNITDVNTVADNIADVNTVVDNLPAVNTVADNIDDVNTVADNIDDVTNFADVYYGPSATDPDTRRDGSPLQPGDLYFNTSGGMRVYSSQGVWVELPLSANMSNVTFSGDGEQTEFQLPYAPGTKANLWVYIGGVYQQKGTFDISGDVLTFATPPMAGEDNIEVVLLSVTQSDAVLRLDLADPNQGAALLARGTVSYDTLSALHEIPEVLRRQDQTYMVAGSPFRWNGVSFQPMGRVHVAAFGADPTGIVDSKTAVVAAVESGYKLDWGAGTYRCSGRIGEGRTLAAPIDWLADDALVYLDSSEHVADFFNYVTTPMVHTIKGRLMFDGMKKCNIVFNLRNNHAPVYPENFAAVDAEGLGVRGARRMSGFRGGAGLMIEGAFHYIIVDNLRVEDCSLAPGAGVPGTIGISGAIFARNSTSGGYPLFVRCRKPNVRMVYSEDPEYTVDQDGIEFVGSFGTAGAMWSSFVVDGGTFENCSGRSIKSQMATGRVSLAHFIRNTGPSSGGNEEIAFQGGMGVVEDITFDYQGVVPSSVVSQRVSVINPAPGRVRGVSGVVQGATLPSILSSYSPPGLTLLDLKGVDVVGPLEQFINFRAPNGNAKCVLEDARAALTSCGVRASSGGINPLPASVSYVEMKNVTNLSPSPVLAVRQRIPGIQINAVLSSSGLEGFFGWTQSYSAPDEEVGPVIGGQRMGQAVMLGSEISLYNVALGGGATSIPAGQTVTLPLLASGMYMVHVMDYVDACAIFCATRAGGGRIYTLMSGASLTISASGEPETGIIRVWCQGDNLLYFKNTSSASRLVFLTRMGGHVAPVF